ncbi:hypothetical protein NLJ89_g10479 [Agrocybe chaxingu]|uniref:SWIM-type domain-containing protein n=1 Tax=Agrocybe chaxingu TaxID=84603 RepID=A0A9W8MS36_9AGAR|nr:hypothetical protein NLJ89_g10479 [Agrocybe chaxingu]
MNNPNRQKCSKCKKEKPVDATQFKCSRGGTFAKICQHQKKEREAATKENPVEERAEEDSGSEDKEDKEDKEGIDRQELGNISLDAFLHEISEAEQVHLFVAFVDISELEADSVRERADLLAQKIWEEIDYQFIYNSHYKLKRTSATRFTYTCAQNRVRQHKPKKGKRNGAKQRDKDRMDAFNCRGWLHMTISEVDTVALLKLDHKEDHVPYWNIDVPEDVHKLIEENLDLTVSQIWSKVLEIYKTPSFSRKSISYIWHEKTSHKWKQDPDELKSAKILIEEATSTIPKGNPLYSVQSVPLHEEEGFTAIAFSLLEILQKWGGKIREVELDSACIYSFQSSQSAKEGGKQRYIEELLEHFKSTWELAPIFTLTDKDFAEINVFLKKFPEAKHQLCFWHCLRAIKTQAYKEFEWIDKNFVPLGQRNRVTKTQMNTARAIPEPPPCLTLRLNGIVCAVVTIPPGSREKNTPNQETTSELERSSENTQNNADNENCEEGDLLDLVDEAGDDDQDEEDGPDWMFDEGETRSPDPNYVFCPAPHRKQLLHLFTWHFCQHPCFPERKEARWSAEKIRANAAYEMYSFCYTRGLAEVWGYMWACWYSPRMWKLWARSTSQYVSRVRTTMAVENFWRQLKHNYLHKSARPRLDFLVWILIYQVTPEYFARGDMREESYRLGRPKELTPYQQYFKKEWQKLEKRGVGTTQFDMDIEKWTCNCGAQKYHCHHLCKHLVQGVPPPSSKFFRDVVRRRTMPLYQHKELVPKSQSGQRARAYQAARGGITEGDDRAPSTDLEAHRGPRKHTLADIDCDAMSTRTPKRTRTRVDLEVEVIDLTLSSPVHPMEQATLSSTLRGGSPMDTRSSSPVGMGSEDEDEPDTYIKRNANMEYVKKLADDLEKGAEMMRHQIEHKSYIWLKSIVDRRIGSDVQGLVADVQHHTRTGKKRSTTWADGKSKQEKRRAQNTMGYIP